MKILMLIVSLALVAGCSRPRETQAVSASPAPAPAPAPAVAPAPPPAPPVPTGNLHGFAPDAVVSVTFKEINDAGYPIVVLRNLTGRDIETIRGSFRLEDADGTYLHGAGLTIAVPGQLFIPANGEVDSSPFGLNRKVDAMQRLADAPGELSFSFQAQDVTFLDNAAPSGE